MIDNIAYIRTLCTVPYDNLALEQHLMESLAPGQCILYLWQNRHTVVIGRNQNAWKECRIEPLERDGGFLARRRSGGGAVYHDLGNLNFTFIAHDEHYSLDRQFEVVVSALGDLGVRAVRSGRNDICADGRKISGNAFSHMNGKSCHHGTLLLSCDMDKLSHYLNVSPDKMSSKGVSSVRSRVANIGDFTARADVDSVCAALVKSFARVYGSKPREVDPEQLDARRLEQLRAEFASWEWRLGRPIKFSQELYRRFAWGDIQLLLRVDHGFVQEAAAYSDALETGFISALPRSLVGRPFSPALADAVPADAGEHPMSADIKRMILENF